MKKLSFYLLVAGALLTGSCSDDSIGEQIPDGGTSIPTVSKITSVFTNGTNLRSKVIHVVEDLLL